MEFTGSSYDGEMNVRNQMDGFGEFKLPSGSVYKGNFKDGQFHGEGVLYLVGGTQFHGIWKNGKTVRGKIVLEDGLEWDPHEWSYCTTGDRRFYSEVVVGLKPAGRSQLTNNLPPPTIPKECYDTGDGFYNPYTRVVTDYKGKFVRYTNSDEHAWIIPKCRKGWDQVVGKTVE